MIAAILKFIVCTGIPLLWVYVIYQGSKEGGHYNGPDGRPGE